MKTYFYYRPIDSSQSPKKYILSASEIVRSENQLAHALPLTSPEELINQLLWISIVDLEPRCRTFGV
jgi:hypothetical protein